MPTEAGVCTVTEPDPVSFVSSVIVLLETTSVPVTTPLMAAIPVVVPVIFTTNSSVSFAPAFRRIPPPKREVG